MEKNIKYYVELLNSIKDEIDDNKTKILEYESMIMKEKTILARMSIFKRFFSGSKRLIIDLQHSIDSIQLENKAKEKNIQKKRSEMVSIGVQELENNDNKMKEIYKEHELYFKLTKNLDEVSKCISKVIEMIEESSKSYDLGKRHAESNLNSASENYYVTSYQNLVAAINQMIELSKFIDLKDYASCEKHPSEFSDNYRAILKHIVDTNEMIKKIKVAIRKEGQHRVHSRVIIGRKELIAAAQTSIIRLYHMVKNEKSIFESRLDEYQDIIDTELASREADVLASIRANYDLKIF